jgi:tetratricopeptide (TPR) repeat protein
MYCKNLVLKFINVLIASFLLISCGGNSNTQLAENPKDSSEANSEIIAISKQIEENPDNAELLYKRSNAYQYLAYLNKAEADINQAIILDSINPLYRFYQGKLLYAMNQTIKASQSYQKAIDLKPDFTEAKMKLAELYFLVKKHKESINLVNSVIASDNSNAVAFQLKALNYKDMADTAAAVRYFQAAIERDPNDYDSHLFIARIFDAMHNKLAIEYFNAALRIKPNGLDALFGRAVLYQRNKLYKAALKDYRKIITADPSNYSSYYNVGYINFETAKFEEALRHFKICVQMKNDFIDAYYMRGLCYEALGNKKDAILNYQFVVDNIPENSLAKEGLQRLSKK